MQDGEHSLAGFNVRHHVRADPTAYGRIRDSGHIDVGQAGQVSPHGATSSSSVRSSSGELGSTVVSLTTTDLPSVTQLRL